MTALTVYGSNIAAATVTTAGLLDIAAGGASVGVDTALGVATGIGELWALGTVSAWPALGAYPSTPSGKGYLYDSTALEGLQIQAGVWTPTMRITAHNGTVNVTADLTAIIWIRHSNGTYTQIGICTLAAQTISFSASTTYTFGGTSLAALNFAAGDKLYIDYYANVTANANGATTTLRINESSSGTLGTNTNQVVTPGYVVDGSATVASNSAIAEAAQLVTAANVQSNSLANEASAFVLAPANVQGNSAMNQAARLLAPANVQGNSAISEAATLIASATNAQSNSLLNQANALLTALANVQSNSVVVEAGTVIVAVPGTAPVSDKAANGTTISDIAVNKAAIVDAAQNATTLSDKAG